MPRLDTRTLVLGLDIGSTTTKAALVAVADEVAVVHVARTSTPSGAAALIEAAAAVSRECLLHADGPVAAVGIASMAESGTALDRDGRALTPLLRWDRTVDPRHLDDLLARHPDLPSRTGVPATTKPVAVALRALRAEQPDTFGAMRHWAGVADLVAHALTGVRATDHTLAARTMLAGGRGEAWDAELLRDLGLSPSVLAEVRVPGEPVAATTDATAAFGLAAGVPVYVAGHDHAVGAWAVGVREPGAVADSLGTAEAVVRIAPAPENGARGGTWDAAARTRAVADGFSVGRTVDGSALTILGGSRACGALLEWWAAEHPADDVVATLSALPADEWPVAGMTVLPYPSGRQCPEPDPAARVRVRVRDEAQRPADRARAVLQGLVFHARWMREATDAHAGSPAHDLTLLGSLADRVPAWAPLVAAGGISTHLARSVEPVAAGAALLAAVRAGAASPALSLSRAPVDATRAPGLDHAYRRFLEIVHEGES